MDAYLVVLMADWSVASLVELVVVLKVDYLVAWMGDDMAVVMVVLKVVKLVE